MIRYQNAKQTNISNKNQNYIKIDSVHINILFGNLRETVVVFTNSFFNGDSR